MESDPQRAEDATASLDVISESGGRCNKDCLAKLLSKSRDVSSDRDVSVLPLLEMTLSGAENKKSKVHTKGKKETKRYDRRLEDSVDVCPSPGRGGSLRCRRKTGGSASKRTTAPTPVNKGILKRTCPGGKSTFYGNVGDHQQHFFDKTEGGGGMVTDTDDSSQSFYSCPGTPSRSEPGRDFSPSILSTLDNQSSIPVAQRPRRIVSYSLDLGTVQQTSHLRPSIPVNGEKRPQLSKLAGFGTLSQSQHPPVKNQDTSERPTLASFDTTTSSPKSSFDASSSFSNKEGKDWSPPTSADTSSNEAEDAELLVNSAIRPKSYDLSLPVDTERIDNRFSGEAEAPYNADLDSDETDVDNPERNPVTPLKRCPRRPSRKKPFSTSRPKDSGYKDKQAKVVDKGKDEDEDEDEAAFQRLAKDFFGEEPDHPTLDLQLESLNKYYKDHLSTDKDREVQAGVALDEAGGGLVTDWLSDLSTSDSNGDEFGMIDRSFEVELLQISSSKSTTHPLQTLRFSVQYEATRVALDHKIHTNKAICAYLNAYSDDLYEAEEYQDLWSTLTRFSREYLREDPTQISRITANIERTSESVWAGFKERYEWPDNVYLTGKIHYGETLQVPSFPAKGKQDSTLRKDPENTPLTVTLNPLTRTCGNRFFNRFGSDRFLTLRLPSLQDLPKDNLRQVHERIINWLVDEEIELMNRTWKCFYVKGGRKSRRKSASERVMITESFNEAVFFATKGVGIGNDINDEQLEVLGFKKDYRKLRQEMGVEDLLKWHIPLEGNMDMTVPKFWSRISLGFSDGTPTVTFKPTQIEFVDDTLSPTGEVMDDGCSIASPAVMKLIRQKLSYDVTPTAVQARLGGAKGIWMIDPEGDWNSDEIYIKVTKSQLKYKGYGNDEDWARLTLDVLDASHGPIPATINTQLIPILECGGVPFTALKELLEEHLEEDLEELFQIIDEPVELRRWMYDRGNVAKDRAVMGAVTTCGALPVAKHEIVILLLESGFLVRRCNYLMKLVREIIGNYCNDLKAKLHIRSPHSTRLFCVADPTGTLKEGEVSLRFSKGILNPKTMRRDTVITGDILVARNPAHLPSDIQKVKAVDIQSHHSPKLKELQDVIVFSVKGDRSLASLLSGGDYDGDKPWVCWDEKIVQPFKNSKETFNEYEKKVEQYFEKSSETMYNLDPHQPGFFNRFFRAGISNSLQENVLGQCTSAWEKFCYSQNRISDPPAIELAKMCSILVDAPKQGQSILPKGREKIAKILRRLPRPAYRDPECRTINSPNVIDKLYFDVTGQKVMEMRAAFYKGFGDPEPYEPELTEIYRYEEAKEEEALRRTLMHLRDELRSLRDAWSEWNDRLKGNTGDEFRVGVSKFYRRFTSIEPPEELSKDPAISHWISDGDSHLTYSYWSLLRASAAYYTWKRPGTLVWHMAGRELCFIMSRAAGRKSEFGPRTMIEEMYVPLKTPRKYRGIRKAKEEEDV